MISLLQDVITIFRAAANEQAARYWMRKTRFQYVKRVFGDACRSRDQTLVFCCELVTTNAENTLYQIKGVGNRDLIHTRIDQN
jgi:hypothetical protein